MNTQKKDRKSQRKSDSSRHVHKIALVTFRKQSCALSGNFKRSYIDENKNEPLFGGTLGIHFIQNLIEDDIGFDNARDGPKKKRDNHD